MKDLICIICPRGCHLKVDENLNVSGNTCPRGAAYAKQELTDPRRTLTSTVRISSSICSVLPVRTSSPIPKGKIAEAMEEINAILAKAPVEMGQVIKEDLAGTGISLIAERDILE